MHHLRSSNASLPATKRSRADSKLTIAEKKSMSRKLSQNSLYSTKKGDNSRVYCTNSSSESADGKQDDWNNFANFMNAAEVKNSKHEKPKFDNSDDARSYEEGERQRRMKLQALMA